MGQPAATIATSKRPGIGGAGKTLMEDLYTMSEGNPGAVFVLAAIIGEEGPLGYITILNLDDMNIRGSQIWIGYKDHCREDLKEFIACTNRRDDAMIATINASRGGPEGEVAVKSGASFLR